MRYEVYYRRVSDGRAPERVHLQEDYRRGGTVVAENIRRLEHLLATQPEVTSKFVGETRRILVGDVVIEKETNWARIYTATGAWATVQLVRF